MKPVIYCDFDGTITESDNIIAIMKRFSPPNWEKIKDQILSREISISEGVGKLFSGLPSEKEMKLQSLQLKMPKYEKGFQNLLNLPDKKISLFI